MFGTDYKVEVSVVLGDRGRLYQGFRVMNCFAHRRGHFLSTDLSVSFILSFSISGTLQSGVVSTRGKKNGAECKFFDTSGALSRDSSSEPWTFK